jgi:hypothetical protein
MADPAPKADDTGSDVDRALARLGAAIAANPANHEPEPPPTPAKGPEATKHPDFTHKRTNRELRRPCERYRAQP